MTPPVVPEPLEGGSRLPSSVLRRRPAQVVVPRQRTPSAVEQRPPRVLRPAPRTTKAPQTTRAPRTTPTTVDRLRRVPLGMIAVIVVFIGLFAVAAGLGAATNLDLSSLFREPAKPPPRAFPVLDPSPPLRLTIPSLKIEAPVAGVGRADDGTVAVPPLARHHEAGWFDEGPSPGQFGPALIVGHADTRTGPSIFHDLGKMRTGQRIEVLRRDHSVAVFKVTSVEHFDKSKLPIKRVYGDYSRPSLRLVTCGGTWLGGDAGYSDNVIVFAALVGSEKT